MALRRFDRSPYQTGSGSNVTLAASNGNYIDNNVVKSVFSTRQWCVTNLCSSGNYLTSAVFTLGIWAPNYLTPMFSGGAYTFEYGGKGIVAPKSGYYLVCVNVTSSYPTIGDIFVGYYDGTKYYGAYTASTMNQSVYTRNNGSCVFFVPQGAQIYCYVNSGNADVGGNGSVGSTTVNGATANTYSSLSISLLCTA